MRFLGIFFLPVICSYRLVFDVPTRGAYHQMPPGLPRADETEETNSYLPGFITEFRSCIQPPRMCPNENITFWFYTRSTRDNPVQIALDQPESFQRIFPDNGKPWKLLIHGYTGYRDYAPNPEIRSAYFEHGEYNIISVDYGPLVRSPCYWSAVSNVPLIANCTSQMLDALIQKQYFSLEELHVIGFSLGAQISGHLHLFLKSGTFTRITGLDPAMPLFITQDNDGKLDESDANFVDVIHTNAGQRGVWQRAGHVDFYVNGGYGQPGCQDTESSSVSSCNHERAVLFYAESIGTKVGFWGVPCGSSVTYYWGWCPANEENELIMGEYTPDTSRGTYYLETNKSSPYALGKESDYN